MNVECTDIAARGHVVAQLAIVQSQLDAQLGVTKRVCFSNILPESVNPRGLPKNVFFAVKATLYSEYERREAVPKHKNLSIIAVFS